MPGSRWWRPAGRYQRSCAFAVVAAVCCALLAVGSASASELPRERERTGQAPERLGPLVLTPPRTARKRRNADRELLIARGGYQARFG